jgi:hypothetical protein
MPLQFLGEVGVYVPKRDAVKFTALHGENPVACYAKRSALMAFGCHAYDDPMTILRVFEKHRAILERSAALKHAEGGLGEVIVSGHDLKAISIHPDESVAAKPA